MSIEQILRRIPPYYESKLNHRLNTFFIDELHITPTLVVHASIDENRNVQYTAVITIDLGDCGMIVETHTHKSKRHVVENVCYNTIKSLHEDSENLKKVIKFISSK